MEENNTKKKLKKIETLNDYYAFKQSGNNINLQHLLEFCYKNRITVINSFPGDDKNDAFIYFATEYLNLERFKYIINQLIVKNYHIRYEVKNCISISGYEGMIGILIKFNIIERDQIFNELINLFNEKNYVGTKNVCIDSFMVTVNYISLVCGLPVNDAVLSFDNNEYYFKLFNSEYFIRGNRITLGANIEGVNKFNNIDKCLKVSDIINWYKATPNEMIGLCNKVKRLTKK